MADDQRMVVVHGTQRFRDRVPAFAAGASDRSTTLLGSWYVTVLRWRPAAALFVNESTLVAVLVACAPARNLLRRFPAAVADVLAALGAPGGLIDGEVAEMGTALVAPTASRSVVGVTNEFGYLAEVLRGDYLDDLAGMSVRLAATPCGPLYRRHVSPDRELAAFVARHAGR
jgi:hypothetical protein